METHEFIDHCPSFDRLNQAIEQLRICMDSVKNELSGDEDEKSEYLMEYITEKL